MRVHALPSGGAPPERLPLPDPGKARAVAFVPGAAGTQRKAWLCAALPRLRTQTSLTSAEAEWVSAPISPAHPAAGPLPSRCLAACTRQPAGHRPSLACSLPQHGPPGNCKGKGDPKEKQGPLLCSPQHPPSSARPPEPQPAASPGCDQLRRAIPGRLGPIQGQVSLQEGRYRYQGGARGPLRCTQSQRTARLAGSHRGQRRTWVRTERRNSCCLNPSACGVCYSSRGN